jgi:hypothetical protein
MSAANPTWTDDIQQMFTATDIQHMQGQGIDLSDYAVVSDPQLSQQILQEVTPPDPTKEPKENLIKPAFRPSRARFILIWHQTRRNDGGILPP